MSENKLREMMFEEPAFEMFPGSSELARQAMARQQERWDELEKDAQFLEGIASNNPDEVVVQRLKSIAQYLREGD